MAARPDVEAVEAAGRHRPRLADVVDAGAGRSLAEAREEPIEGLARTLRDAADRAIRLVGDPAAEPEPVRHTHDEPAKADTLDPAPDGGLEALVDGHGQRAGVATPMARASRRRGQARRRPSRTSSGETLASSSSPARVRRARNAGAAPPGRPSAAAISSSSSAVSRTSGVPPRATRP